MYGHAAFFTYVIDEPADRLGLLAKLFIGEFGLERGEAVDDDGRRMPTGDKAINLIHGLVNRSTKADKRSCKLCIFVLHRWYPI